MKKTDPSSSVALSAGQNKHRIMGGQLDLTYRCNLDCIHCYCKGIQDKGRELDTEQWKKAIDGAYAAGCMYLFFSGGEPLLKEDFREIYAHARRKGFIITIFTNGQAFTKAIIDFLVVSPPYSIEITLNGITAKTYENITQVKGSFARVMQTIETIKKRGLPLIIKANCLKENRHELIAIKQFADRLLGSPQGRYRFKYDPLILPRLNGDQAPCSHRLSCDELIELRRQDPEMWQDYRQHCIQMNSYKLKRDSALLYQCNHWADNFFIDAYGKIKPCGLSQKHSVDFSAVSFEDYFDRLFSGINGEKFKTDSRCHECHLRPICLYCPARAYLETGSEEGPVEYYCQMARATSRQMGIFLDSSKIAK